MSLLDDVNAAIAALVANPEVDYQIGDKRVNASQKLRQLLDLRGQLMENPNTDMKVMEFEGFDISELGQVT